MTNDKGPLPTLRTLYDFIVDVTYADNGHRFVGYKDDVELDKIHPGIEAALNDAQKMLMNVIYTADGTSIVGAVSDGAVFAGILIGKMEADDTGYLFGCMTESICGTMLAPSFLGIEALLTSLRKKYAEGWRLVPPSSTVTVSPDLAALDEAMKRCYENIMTRWGLHNLCSVLDALERGSAKPESGGPA